MKKLILNAVILSVTLLFACNKDHANVQPQSAGKTKYKISFNLNGFTQQIIGKASKPGKAKILSLLSDTASVRAMFDSIGYVLMDSQGNLVHSKIYNAKTYTNSTISDSVLPGNYKVALFAGHNGIQILNGNPLFLWYGTTLPQNYGNFVPFKDTFEQTIPITVTNANINQSVTLNRIVGDIEVVITDNVPANAYSFTMQFSYDVFYYNLYTATPFDWNVAYPNNPVGPGPSTTIIPNSSKGKPNFTIDYATLNNSVPFSFTLDCVDSSGQLLAHHAFDTTTIQANVKKIYSGDLFRTPLIPGSGSSTTVNPVWNPITTNISF